jgi:conjugal transfer pilus assembly protein TraB
MTGPATRADEVAKAKSVDNYLPVSFTRAVLLGGLDAPTGGQSQTNPHPVLLRLVDSAVLPNRYRGEVRECFVIGAGYGDISSERAYVRTENLSCIRHDGSTLEIAIQGSIFGEDGKVGMRGRLVTKQGQLLANALLAGVVSGIGTAFSQYYTTTTTSTFGTISTTDPNKAIQSGLGTGVGSAMNRLANYYISLAEKIFPVIEIDAGRMVDVVLTKGVVIDAPLNVGTIADPTTNRPARQGRLQRAARDEDED